MALQMQLAGLLLLVGGVWFGYRQWVRRHDATLTAAGRGLLVLLVMTMAGGFVGSPFWWTDQPLSFSWDLPPLASRMLAAAGWSFFVVTLLALRRPTYRRVRLILLLLFVYLVPLTVLILLAHLDRFDFSAPITYAFFGIVLLMDVATTYYLLRQPAIIADDARDSLPASTVTQVWLPIVATITAIWGLALLVTDRGPLPLLWAWPGDLLSSRLIAVMLLAIAVGSLYAMRTAATARMMLAMIVVYSLGITVASAWNRLFGLPIETLYTAVFSIILLVSAVLLMSERSSRDLNAHPMTKMT